MKIIATAAALFFCASHSSLAQYNKCTNYDYERAVKYMKAYWLEDDNLELITGDTHFGKFFDISKGKFLKKCTFIPIPSLLIDYQAMKSDTSRSFKELLKPHYQIYSTFLLEQGKLVTLLKSGSSTPPNASKIAQASFVEDKETAKLYSAYNKPSVCLFYEPALHVYAFVKDNKLFYYDQNSTALKRFSKKDYLAYYASYYSTDK